MLCICVCNRCIPEAEDQFLSGCHPVESPMSFVIRMKQDQICLYFQPLKIKDPLFQMLKGCRIESREIPCPRRCTFKWIKWRFVGVPAVVLWKHAHTYLVEPPLGQGPDGLLLQFLRLMYPCIQGCTYRPIWRTICIREMECACHSHWSMVALCRTSHIESSLDCI